MMVRLCVVVLTILLASCASQKVLETKDSAPEDVLISKPASFDEELPTDLSKVLRQAQGMVNSGDFKSANQLLESSKAQFVGFPQISLNQALIAIQEKDFELAQAHVETAIQVRETYAPSYNLLGVIYRITGQFGDSKSAYEKALSLAPNYTNALLNLGILADLYLQDWPLALQSFEQYLSLVGTDEKVENWIVELKQRMPEQQGG